jgi:dTMP kinase
MLLSNETGIFIVLDGPDGCGKSTQCKMLTEWLRGFGKTVETFRDPGTTFIGEKIRDILLDPEHDAMDVRTEMLLYMAARAQLWHEKIGPALRNGSCVVMDRWVSSTCAYQGGAGELGIDAIVDIAEKSLERVWPDLTIVLDVDIATSASRMDRELDRMELKGDEYHKKVREGFLELAGMTGDIAVVDATQDIQTVHDEVIGIVKREIETLR